MLELRLARLGLGQVPVVRDFGAKQGLLISHPRALSAPYRSTAYMHTRIARPLLRGFGIAVDREDHRALYPLRCWRHASPHIASAA